ncbi:MAG: carboxypeptidase regulatory-like domain-containing protein [Gemmatimonadaceae bacterium]|nr:carboxypeptidase regulatory-like domain-containing protein [Gemmatimonadaceae bacterium]
MTSRGRFNPVLFAFLATALFAAGSVGAQGTAAINGVVTDSEGLPIYGALVSTPGTGHETRSDERGEFRFIGLQPGGVDIAARRLGYAPASAFVNIASGVTPERVRIVLAILPAMLDQVTVQRTRMRYTGRLAGYYQRLEQRGTGQFITRADIEVDESRSLSQLLAASPGVRRWPVMSGGSVVRMRNRNNCPPLVWIDGVAMPIGDVDLDAFPLHTLHGVELYLGASNTPIEYTAQNRRSSCGSIMLWSRGRDTEGPSAPKRSSVDLERLVSSMAVYTADQVDQRAELLSPERLRTAYPPELHANTISGSLTAEFVVDTSGKVEPETFTVVSTSHRLLGTAVARAIQESVFVPAMKDGRPVRQFVRQRVDFGPRREVLSDLK